MPGSSAWPTTQTNGSPVTRRARQHSLLWSAIPLTLATAAVGMFRVGQHALSVDESISLRVARQPLFAAGRIVAETDAALPSPYELILHVWQFGGTSETFLRSLSVTLGVGTVLVLFALNVRLFD